MQKIEGCNIKTAKSTEEIIENIKYNVSKNYVNLLDSYAWRENIPIAIVGGGPSLKNTVGELKNYKYIIACGSVHDYLLENKVVPHYCVICDPDEIMGNYLQKKTQHTTYFIASQCHPSIFKLLSHSPCLICSLASTSLPPADM